jgi:hypothetical protein
VSAATRAGVLLGAVVSAPALYGLVEAGNLDTVGALQRGAVVAVGTAVGATFVARLVDSYRRAGPAPVRRKEGDQDSS